MRNLALLLCLCALPACRGPTTRPRDQVTPPTPRCGDGAIDVGEACDGSALADTTCVSLGFDRGQIACSDQCQFVTTLCEKQCGNGVVDPGEACDGDAGLPACATFGYQSCTDRCGLSALHCVAMPFGTGPSLTLTRGGPSMIADVSPPGPGDLVTAVASFSRLEVFPWNAQSGFDQSAGRKLSLARVPRIPGAAELSGDGAMDLHCLNEDDSLSRMTFNGTGFTSQPVADAGCPLGRFLGAGRFNADGGQGALWACQGSALVLTGDSTASIPSGATAWTWGDFDRDGLDDVVALDSAGALTVRPAPGFEADAGQTLSRTGAHLAAGDLDGDGDVDLALLDGAELAVFENTGAGFGERAAIPAAGATFLVARDMDLDGRVDLVFAQGDDVVVRRNRGGFQFSEWRAPAGLGLRLSFSVGDADGDGDPDVAVTVTLGGDATRTDVVLNRVR